MFSFNFTIEAAKQFIYHPSAIFKLHLGTTATSEFLDLKRRQKWLKHPVTQKHTRLFTILLHQHDDTGLSAHIGSDGLYEPAETSLIQKILRQNMTFVDVGANIGWYTLLAASKVGSKGRVIAFEPEPANYNLLIESIALNNFENVILLKKCLSNSEGKSRLYLHPQNYGAHSIVRQQSKFYKDVITEKLDDSLTNLGINNVDVLKIDVEGAEPLVLEGAQQTIFRGPKHIFLEWNADAWQNKTELFEKLFTNYDLSNS